MPNQAIKQAFEEIKNLYKGKILEVKNDPNLSNAEKVTRIKELTAEAKMSINNKKKELMASIEKQALQKELEHLSEIENAIKSI